MTTKGPDMQTALQIANKDFEHSTFAHAVYRWVDTPAQRDKVAVEKLMDEELRDCLNVNPGGLDMQSKVFLSLTSIPKAILIIVGM